MKMYVCECVRVFVRNVPLGNYYIYILGYMMCMYAKIRIEVGDC